MLYENAEEAQARLHNTIVLYDGHPCLVLEVVGGKKPVLRLTSCPNYTNNFDVPLLDTKLNYTDYRLGYYNLQGRDGYPPRAVYLQRMPVRKYKQGLNSGNVTFIENGQPVRLGFDGICRYGSFVDMFKNKYPTLQETVDKLREAKVVGGHIPSIAFRKNLALSYDTLGFFKLHYKGEEVGWGDPDGLQLPSQYEYLREILNENGVNTR